MSWDLYWRFERHRRAADPLDARRWKRDSARALRVLYPTEGVRLLDATAGLGDHTVNLAEEGFVVEACDASPIAREATREACAAAELDVPVFDARWERLEQPGRYALIFHDALHWIYEPDALRAALRGLHDALEPGGALVFFFADAAEGHEGAGLGMLESDWEHMRAPREAWSHEVDGVRVTLSLSAERGPDYIDEHHRYDEDGAVHELTMRHVYRWDWHALSPLLREAGFVDARTDHFRNVKDRWFAMSLAFRAGG